MASSETMRIPCNLFVEGNIQGKSNTPSAGSVIDSSVAANAGIQASKLQHQHQLSYSQGNVNAVADQKVVHVVRGATGTLESFSVGLITPPDTASGGKTAIVNLLVNGVSVLTAAITLDSTAVSRNLAAATITTSAIVAEDVIEVAVTLGAGSTGTAPIGVFAALVIRESAD